jgi:hypothetical protein
MFHCVEDTAHFLSHPCELELLKELINPKIAWGTLLSSTLSQKFCP